MLDLIGEIGGLFDGLLYIAQFFLGLVGLFWSEPFYTHIISSIYSIETDSSLRDGNFLKQWVSSFMIRRKTLRIGVEKIDRQLEIKRFLTRYRLQWK